MTNVKMNVNVKQKMNMKMNMIIDNNIYNDIDSDSDENVNCSTPIEIKRTGQEKQSTLCSMTMTRSIIVIIYLRDGILH